MLSFFLLFDVDEANLQRIGGVVQVESVWKGNNPVKWGVKPVKLLIS
jgi:hypothetical protein